MQHKRQNLQQPKQGNDSQQQKKQHTFIVGLSYLAVEAKDVWLGMSCIRYVVCKGISTLCYFDHQSSDEKAEK